MVEIIGNYKMVRQENLNEFYIEIDKSWEATTILCNRLPAMQINKEKEEQWCFKTVFNNMTILENRFKLNEEYEDSLPSGTPLMVALHLIHGNSITTMDGDHKLVTMSKGVEEAVGLTIETHYDFNEHGMVITFRQPNGPGLTAKCYFNRIPSLGRSD